MGDGGGGVAAAGSGSVAMTGSSSAGVTGGADSTVSSKLVSVAESEMGLGGANGGDKEGESRSWAGEDGSGDSVRLMVEPDQTEVVAGGSGVTGSEAGAGAESGSPAVSLLMPSPSRTAGLTADLAGGARGGFGAEESELGRRRAAGGDEVSAGSSAASVVMVGG